jgi:hypothetical protein
MYPCGFRSQVSGTATLYLSASPTGSPMRLLALLLGAATASPAFAQSEDHLRPFFEGKRVIVKLEMPGSEDGVDVYPASAQGIDFPQHASRLKRFGTAIRKGDEVLITKIKMKRDLIEFQLGGGGYGTFGDDAGSVHVPTAAKTTRERNLEREIPHVTDPALRKTLREELDALRRRREREDARNRAEAAQAEQTKQANIRQRRIEGGSRFNLRYRPDVPPEALTPDAVIAALSPYVDFTPMLGESAPAVDPTARGGPRSDELRKGLTMDQVDALFGRPESISDRKEGILKVSTSVYRTRDRQITAEFVEGVLIRFTIASP